MKRRHLLNTIALPTVSLLLPACRLLLPPTRDPVPNLHYPASAPTTRQLVICLPGRLSKPIEFERAGLVSLIQNQWPDAEVIIPDLHLGYYQERSVDKVLQHQIVEPAIQKGYRIRMIGISMGGLGALIHALRFPGSVKDLILLAPYLGDEPLLKEIDTAGGLQNWSPHLVEPLTKEMALKKLWLEMRDNWSPPNPKTKPNISLITGDKDRHLPANRLFAQHFLPPNAFQTTPGGHDWPCWKNALQKSLQS